MNSSSYQIVFIGTGRIANSLCEALRQTGIQPVGIVSRNSETARQFATRHAIQNHTSVFNEFHKPFNYCILAVPDEDISSVAADIAGTGRDFSGITFLHLSGSQTVELLNPLQQLGGTTASVHFMMSFPTKVAVPLAGSAAAIESQDDATYKHLYQLCIQLSVNPFRIDTKYKALYHIIGVYLSNFLIDNLYTASRLFEKAGIKDINFFDLSVPIVMATLSNVKTVGMPAALSGPVERASIPVVNQHLEKLKALEAMDDIARDYIAKSLHLLVAARQKNPKLAEGYDEIESMLNQLQIRSTTTE